MKCDETKRSFKWNEKKKGTSLSSQFAKRRRKGYVSIHIFAVNFATHGWNFLIFFDIHLNFFEFLRIRKQFSNIFSVHQTPNWILKTQSRKSAIDGNIPEKCNHLCLSKARKLFLIEWWCMVESKLFGWRWRSFVLCKL